MERIWINTACSSANFLGHGAGAVAALGLSWAAFANAAPDESRTLFGLAGVLLSLHVGCGLLSIVVACVAGWGRGGAGPPCFTDEDGDYYGGVHRGSRITYLVGASLLVHLQCTHGR